MRFFTRLLGLVLAMVCLSTPSLALAKVRVAVIYPEVEQPYANVFAHIIDDLRQQKTLDVTTYSLRDNYDQAAVRHWIRQEKAQTLVALGQRGVDAVESLDLKIPVVVGAVLYMPPLKSKLVSGISLTPDPALLLKHLKQLAPSIKRVHVVYNPDRYQWLIDDAKAAAKPYSLHIIARKAKDLRSAAPLYRKLLEKCIQGEDAIWLLQDSSTVGNSSILPLVLKVAWDKKLVVFSSNPRHVSRGVLFSLYAEQDALGKSLAHLLLQQTSGKGKPSGLLPFSDVRLAVNLRTAGHIDLDISFEQRRQFGLVYPKR